MFMTLLPLGIAQSTENISYSTKCETCHGKTGLADTTPGKLFQIKPFTDSTVIATSDSGLQDEILNGSGKMPPFKGKLSTTELANLIQYIRQLQTSH